MYLFSEQKNAVIINKNINFVQPKKGTILVLTVWNTKKLCPYDLRSSTPVRIPKTLKSR